MQTDRQLNRPVGKEICMETSSLKVDRQTQTIKQTGGRRRSTFAGKLTDRKGKIYVC